MPHVELLTESQRLSLQTPVTDEREMDMLAWSKGVVPDLHANVERLIPRTA